MANSTMGRRSFPAQNQPHCEVDSTTPTSDSTSVQAKAGELPKGCGLLFSCRKAQSACSCSVNSTNPKPLLRGLPSLPSLPASRKIFTCRRKRWITLQLQGALNSKAQYQSTRLLEMWALCHSPLLHLSGRAHFDGAAKSKSAIHVHTAQSSTHRLYHQLLELGLAESHWNVPHAQTEWRNEKVGTA